MALINCSECGKEISDKALSCPNCGCPLKANTILEDNNDDKDSTGIILKNYSYDLVRCKVESSRLPLSIDHGYQELGVSRHVTLYQMRNGLCNFGDKLTISKKYYIVGYEWGGAKYRYESTVSGKNKSKSSGHIVGSTFGAAIGTALMPGVGTIAGALIGGSGKTKTKGEKDEKVIQRAIEEKTPAFLALQSATDGSIYKISFPCDSSLDAKIRCMSICPVRDTKDIRDEYTYRSTEYSKLLEKERLDRLEREREKEQKRQAKEREKLRQKEAREQKRNEVRQEKENSKANRKAQAGQEKERKKAERVVLKKDIREVATKFNTPMNRCLVYTIIAVITLVLVIPPVSMVATVLGFAVSLRWIRTSNDFRKRAICFLIINGLLLLLYTALIIWVIFS